MPIFDIEDENGVKLSIEGDVAPDANDIEELFTAHKLSQPRVPSPEALAARPKIAAEIAEKSASSPQWVADILNAVSGPNAQAMVPTGGNMLNAPVNFLNAMSGKEVVRPYNGLDFSGLAEAPLKVAETALSHAIPGGVTLTQENSPFAGVARSVDATLSGVSNPDMLLTLPAYSTGIPQAVAPIATAGRALVAADMLRHLPEVHARTSQVISDPNSTPAQIGEALMNQGVADTFAAGASGAIVRAPKAPPLTPAEMSADLAARIGLDTRSAPAENVRTVIKMPMNIENPLADPRVSPIVEQAFEEARARAATGPVPAYKSGLVVPVEFSAAEKLRQMQETPEIVGAGTTPTEFRPGGGEAVGGKVSFRRGGEDISLAFDERQHFQEPTQPAVRPEIQTVENRKPLRSMEDIIRDRLAKRDLVAAIDILQNQPAIVQKKIIEDAVGSNRKRVGLNAAEQTIFNELWEKVYQDSLKKGAPNATQKLQKPVVREQQHPGADELRQATETGGSNRPQEGGEVAPKGIGYFDRASETEGLGRPSGAPTLEDIRAQRAAEAKQNLPPIRPGDTAVKIQQPDGTVIDAVTNGKDWEVGGEKIPNVGRAVDLGNGKTLWSDGPLRPGERILSAETQGARGGEGSTVVAPNESTIPPETATPKSGGVQSPPRVTPITDAAQAAIDALKRLKDKSNPPTGQNLHTLSPKAIAEIGKQLYHDALDAGIRALEKGKTIAQAVDAVIAHIRYNVQKGKGKFNEKELRAEIERELGGRNVGSIPNTPPPENKAPSTGIIPPEGQKPRSFSARATVSEKVPEAVQEQIKTDPRSSYTPQRVADVRERVKQMSDAELGSLTLESADYTEGKAELMTRLFDAGKQDAGLDVLQETSANLTRAGQIVNQAKLLNALKPEHQVLVIEKILQKNKKDPLTKKQKDVALETARKAKEAEDVLRKAETDWKNNPSKENEAKAEKALLDANLEALRMQVLHHRYQGRSIWKLLKAILQGNLLTPISQGSNLVGNLTFIIPRQIKRGIETGMDVVQHAIFNTPRAKTVSPIRGTGEAWKGFARGVKQMPGIMMHGTGNTILGEAGLGLHPMDAWVKQFAKEPDMPTVGGKITLADRAKLLIEGTFGVSAEVMLRGLAAIDRPFREMAKARITENELKLAKVPVEQRAFAQKFPELFFDKKVLERIRNESDYAIFQQKNMPLSVLNRMLAEHDFVDFAAATVAPYKLTPINLIGETMSYNPVIAAIQAGYKASKGDRRGANEAAAKMVIGGAMTTAAYLLYNNGMLAPSLESKDETMKERILSGDVLPPNHINVSAIQRVAERIAKGEQVTKEDTRFRKGDSTKSIMKLGLTGAFMYMTANIGRDMEKRPETGNWQLAQQILKQSTLETARFGMNQSFMQGVQGFLNAVGSESEADAYWKKWGNTVMSIPMPNTLASLSKATRTNKPELSDETWAKEAENLIKNRIGIFTSLDEELPLKRGLFGEPLPETPKGQNPFLYHLLDVFKGQQVTDDPSKMEMYRLWRTYDEPKAVPTPPKAEITRDNKRYPLNPKQHSELQEIVGQWRKQKLDEVLAGPIYHTLKDEERIELLDKIYDYGGKVGGQRFWEKHGAELEKKPKKAGFKL